MNFKALEFFCMFSGLDKSEASEFMPLISSSCETIRKKLKDEKYIFDSVVPEAAGALAFYRYSLLEQSKNEPFSIGNIKFEKNNSSSPALEYFYSIINGSPEIFIQDDFAFIEVK